MPGKKGSKKLILEFLIANAGRVVSSRGCKKHQDGRLSGGVVFAN